MIKLLHGTINTNDDQLRDEMYRLRAKVFKDRLQWDVNVVDGKEKDQFDDLDPLYVVVLDPKTHKVQASQRLLQTTGPHMLSDVFSDLVPKEELHRSPLIWESTRFCVDIENTNNNTVNSIQQITCELLAGTFSAALSAGVTLGVSVFDVRVARILKMAGCKYEKIGKSQDYGNFRVMAAVFECSQSVIDTICERGNIDRLEFYEESYDDENRISA